MQKVDGIPVSPSMNPFYGKEPRRKHPVDKRVFYLSLQAIINAIIIGFVAKFLVLLISLITNVAFYHRFSIASSTPAGNQLGLWVLLVPVAGSLIVGLMARFGSKAIRGHGIPEA